ncbi:HalOD1 output domain-containing protein [Natronorubrum thiooxidans]|uniref:HalOD1 output domain-containing protein n=1 Tax=Natronorubrum thiooxidans TaxID=308853 RepID=UPI000971608E
MTTVIVQTTQSLSLKIVEKIAKREGVQPEELKPPIHSAIDTDALDSLYQSSDSDRGPSKVEFRYKGYTVIVDRAGDVDVEKHVASLEPDKTVA